jgi:hypothetical protein
MCRHERGAAAQSVADSVVAWLPAALGRRRLTLLWLSAAGYACLLTTLRLVPPGRGWRMIAWTLGSVAG